MSNTIDNRIVEMQFDNADFEKNIKQSIKSLDQLKENLDFDYATDSFEKFEKSTKNASFDSMNRSLEKIQFRLSGIGTYLNSKIVGALNRVEHAVTKVFKDLTITPITTGFQEYETQINSVQTILANTRDGLSKRGLDEQAQLDLVNQKLDELNHYADKTIYNFTQMTENIGRFTAAGVDLETSVSSIQGIANLAAVSGSTSEQANRAMYNLSQAISSGTLKLMDWNSVVNAGMGGEIFQKALIRTAKSIGIVDEKAKKAFADLEAGNLTFRDSLSSGWITSDILTKTLEQISWDFEEMAKQNQYTDEQLTELKDSLIKKGLSEKEAAEYLSFANQSSVAAAKEIKKAQLLAEGYTLEEADAIIDLAQSATEAATKVKTITQLMDTLKEAAQSGWTQTWEYILGDFGEAKKLFTEISDHFGAIIGKSADARNAIVKGWKDLGGRDSLINTFWNIVGTIENVVSSIRSAFSELIPPVTAETLMSVTQFLEKATAKMKEFTSGDHIKKVFSGISTVLGTIFSTGKRIWDAVVKPIRQWILQALPSVLDFVNEKLKTISSFVGNALDWIGGIKDAIEQSELFQKVWSGAISIFDKIRNGISDVVNAISDFFGSLFSAKDGDGSILEPTLFERAVSVITKFADTVRKAALAVWEWIDASLETIRSNKTIMKVWGSVSSFFKNVWTAVSGFGKKIGDFFKDIFVGNENDDRSIFERLKEKLENLLPKVKEFFKSLPSTIASVFSDVKTKIVSIFSKVRSGFGTVKNAASVALEPIKNFFSGMFEKVKGFVDTIYPHVKSVVDKINSIGWDKILLGLGGAWALFKILSSLGGKKAIGKGLTSIGKGIAGASKGITDLGAGLKEVAKNGIKTTQITKKQDSIGTTLLKLAASFALIVATLWAITKMDPKEILKGMGVLLLIAIEMAIVARAFRKAESSGNDILKASGAMLLMVAPIFILGKIDAETALKGMLMIGALFAELAIISKLSDGIGIANNGSGLIKMAGSILILTVAMKAVGKMDLKEIIKSLVTIFALLAEVALFTRMMIGKKISGIVGLAIGIDLLVIALKSIGNMRFGSIVKGVVGIGGLLISLSVMLKTVPKIKMGSSLATLLLMVGTIAALIMAFKSLKGENFNDLMAVASSIGIVLLSLSASLSVASKAGILGSAKAALGIGAAIVIIGGIITALGWLNEQWSGMSGYLDSGAEIMGKIGRAIGSFFGGVSVGLMSGMPDVGTHLSDFATNVQPFLDSVKKIDDSVVAGVGRLTSVIIAIGGTEFVSALSGLFVGENPVTRFATDIETLAGGLSSFSLAIDGLEFGTNSKIGLATQAAESLATLVQAVKWDLGDWILAVANIDPVQKFAEDADDFADALKTFATSVNGMAGLCDEDDMKLAVMAAGGLADLETAMKHQTVWDAVTGIPNLTMFSAKVEKFAEGMKKYATSIAGFNTTVGSDNIDAVNSAATALVNLENSLKPTGGRLQYITGVPDLSGFGERVEKFAAGMMKYAEVISPYHDSVNPESVNASTSAAQALVALENALQPIGGKFQYITGIKDIGNFGGRLGSFADGMMTYAQKINGFDVELDDESSKNAIKAAEALRDLEKSLAGTGGFFNFLYGEQDLSEFGWDVERVGISLNTFSTNVEDLEVADATKAVNVLTQLSEFAETLEKSGGIWPTIRDFAAGTKEQSMIDLSNDLVTIGTNLKTFADSILTYDPEKGSASVDLIDQVNTLVEKLGKTGGIAGFFSDITVGTKEMSMTRLAETMGTFGTHFQTFSDGISNAQAAYTDFGYAKAIALGFANLAADIKSKKVNTTDLDRAGKALASVFETGVSDSIQNGTSEIGNSLLTVTESLKDGYWDWYGTGYYLGLGLKSGIETAIGTLMTPVSGEQASGTAQNSLLTIRNWLAGIDPNPTIRPVLDLSGVRNGIGELNGMLGSTSLSNSSLRRNVGGMALDSGRIVIARENNPDIRSALNELRELSNKVSVLSRSVGDMRVVLDSGALVGHTIRAIDSQLGILSVRKGRGNG